MPKGGSGIYSPGEQGVLGPQLGGGDTYQQTKSMHETKTNPKQRKKHAPVETKNRKRNLRFDWGKKD